LIYIETTVKEEPFTREVLRRNPTEQVALIESYKQLNQSEIAETDLILIRYKGKFLEKCPGTQKHICCNYYILHWAMGCPFQCTYCYLHGYKNFPGLILHANVSDLVSEVRDTAERFPAQYFRIGTGEFADSLALEERTGFNALVLPSLLSFQNITIELKTKSKLSPELMASLLKTIRNAPHTPTPGGYIDPPLPFPSTQKHTHTKTHQHSPNLVFAWSVNPPAIVTAEEHGAATLPERLESARLCQEAGFSVALHFDPMIDIPDWQPAYRSVVDAIFQTLDPQKIAWVSLGALRFNPKVKKAALEKFPETKIYYGELLPGLDGKLRYFRPRRVELMKTVFTWLNEHLPAKLIYLCMESQEVWREVIPNSLESRV
jgi:spore photoproduct lyase